MLATLDARKTGDCRLQSFIAQPDIRSQLSQHRTNDAFGLLEHRDKNVLRLDLLVLISLGELDCRLNCFLSA